MKKSIICAAVLTAFSAGAMAASVQLYGLADTGLLYEHSKVTGSSATHKFTEESGIAGASRWGMRGLEQLGNGYKIAFQLEGKFNSDDGSMGTTGKIFDRDAYLELQTPYGNIRAGRTGLLASGVNGGIFAGGTNPFGVVYKNAGANGVFLNAAGRGNNIVRLETPQYAGLRGYAMYSFGTDDDPGDGTTTSNTNRYAAIGATYKIGKFSAAAVIDQFMWSHTNDVAVKSNDYSRTYSLMANYNFGFMKVFGGYQHGQDLLPSQNPLKYGAAKSNKYVKGHQADANMGILGVSAPLCGGTAMFSAAYGKRTVDDTDYDEKTWHAAVGYKYNLSKRTFVYGVVSYVDMKQQPSKVKETETKAAQVGFGIHHSF